MNYIEMLEKKYKANRLRIERLLNWTPTEYGQFQYEMGLAYMRDVLFLDDWAQRPLEASPKYWTWWINQWNLHDDLIFLPAVDDMPYSDMEQIYMGSHSPRFLNAHPTAIVMEEAYAKMIGEFNSEVKQVTI